MRLPLSIAACVLAAAIAAPVLAQPGADHAVGPGTAPPYYGGYDQRPVWKEDRRQDGYAADAGSREAWLADCRYRVAQRGYDKGADHCAAWLNANAARYDGYGYGETVMIPVSRPGACTETVVYEDPAPIIRRSIPRPAPARDKRIRLK